MSVAEGRPPYTDEEVDKIASAVVFRTCWGTWLLYHDSIEAFPKLEPRGMIELMKLGAVWVYQFGQDLVPDAVPKFSVAPKWADAESTRRILSAVMLKESLMGRVVNNTELDLSRAITVAESRRKKIVSGKEKMRTS